MKIRVIDFHQASAPRAVPLPERELTRDIAIQAAAGLYDSGAFLEDLRMIGGQQANIDLDASVPRVNIATDTGGVQARRIVESLIAAEQAGGPRKISALRLVP